MRRVALWTEVLTAHARARRVRSPVVVDVSRERFEELVSEALDGLPEDLGRLMDNVAVFVHDEGRSPNLLGLYEGIPLTRRENYGGLALPDRISIYRLPILRRCRSERDVVRQVTVTVVHEVAHHFGISDGRLHELGWA
jgi:predicted Zn-dependent protease with MMP-like domain